MKSWPIFSSRESFGESFRPTFVRPAEVGRAGLQKFVFGENGRGQEQHQHQQKRFAHLQTIARESWVGCDGRPLEDQGVRLDLEPALLGHDS